MGKIYFISDLHLGAVAIPNDLEREKKVVKWLDSIKSDCDVLYLLGDIFDFWFEYKHVVPKGHVRFLGKIAEFVDSGIPVHYFIGNHDIWSFGYFEQELGVQLHDVPELITLYNKRLLIGHGDGLNPNDKGYLRLNRLFKNRFIQRMFNWLHPDLAVAFANNWSSHSRLRNGKVEAEEVLDHDKEEILVHCRAYLKKEKVDYFIFGHRHWPSEIPLEEGAIYFNTGDWISHFSYVTFDGNKPELHFLQE